MELKPQLEDILHSLLPPREWLENGTKWTQYVSSAAATRLDVIHLQEALDHKLMERQARETGREQSGGGASLLCRKCRRSWCI